MSGLVSLILTLVLSDPGTAGKPSPAPAGSSKIGVPDIGFGDGHLLPGWRDADLAKSAADIQLRARDAELRARSILAELDQAFVDLATGRPKISISRKISELDYQIVRLDGRRTEAEGLLTSKQHSVYDGARLQGLKTSISAVQAEMLANRVYFERQYARARLVSADPMLTP